MFWSNRGFGRINRRSDNIFGFGGFGRTGRNPQLNGPRNPQLNPGLFPFPQQGQQPFPQQGQQPFPQQGQQPFPQQGQQPFPQQGQQPFPQQGQQPFPQQGQQPFPQENQGQGAFPWPPGNPQPQQPALPQNGFPPPIPAGDNRLNPPPYPSQAGAAPQGVTPPFDKLSNTGTFMGLPEFSLPGAVSAAPEKPGQAGQSGFGGNSLFTGFRELIQNERNGRDFYGNLAEMPITNGAKESLKSISARAEARGKRLGDMYSAAAGEKFSPENRSVRTDINYFDGLRLAIKEESRSLRSCAEIAESTPDLVLKEKLNAILLEKLCQINELNALLAD